MSRYKSSQINSRITEEQASQLDNLIAKGVYKNRSQAVADIIGQHLTENVRTVENPIKTDDSIPALERRMDELTEFIMNSEKEKERVMVFMDVMNITAQFRYEQLKMDFEEFLNQMVNGRKNVGAYAFDARVIMNGVYDKTRGFHTVIESAGFRQVLRDSYNTAKQQGIDTEIAVQMVYHAMKDDFDTAVLASGDKDLLPAVEMLQNLGKRVEIVCHRSGVSRDLALRADSVQYVDDMFILGVRNEPVREVA